MKSNRYEQAPRLSATGVTTVAILATTLAMALSLVVEPQDGASAAATAAVQASSQVA